MPTTIFTLSRELRDTIYGYVLVSPDPILVHSGPYMHLGRPAAPEIPISSVLALGLLRSNRVLGQESAETFYSKNTFAFLGYHDWDPIISWVTSIGKMREHLKKLDITALQPRHCWQHADGTRVRIPETGREVYQRHPCLSPSVKLTGPVENIKPDIETVFQLLGDWRVRKLTISFLLDYEILPGLRREFDHAEGGDDFTMDLPNLIERFRSNHAGTDDSKIEVLWIGELQRSHFFDNKSMIQDLGWEIVNTKEAERFYYRTLDPTVDPQTKIKVTTFTMQFTLRRKANTDVLVAEDPSPYGMTSLEAYYD